jgi:hypothetical protein
MEPSTTAIAISCKSGIVTESRLCSSAFAFAVKIIACPARGPVPPIFDVFDVRQ